MRTRLLSWLGFLLLIPIGGEAFAESLTLEIPNGNASAIPVAVVPFKFDGTTQPPDTDVADVIRGDLNRSGQFRALAKGDIVEFPTRGEEIKYPTWRMLKQDYIVVGREVEGAGGDIRVEFQLYTVGSQQQLLALAISCAGSPIR